jgi:molecular chaperone DnaJ
MGMIRDYFADLELGPDSTLEDVRKAFKRLARKFHPDVNPLDPHAEESFLRIQEAYDRLNSQTRIERFRKQLDLASFKSVQKNFGRWGEYPLVPKPEQFVSQWQDESSAPKRTTRPEEKLDFWVKVGISQNDAKVGGTKKIRYSFDRPCPSCRGSGGRARSVKATCKKCAGLGHFLIERGAMHWRKTCDECGGKGHIVGVPCESCGGRGKVSVQEIIELKIAKNSDFNKTVVLKGLGHISYDGKRRGDLCVQLVQKQ